MISLFLPTRDATDQLAAEIGKWAEAGTTLLLQGNLGSGKTTFVQGLGRGLGIQELINSPTFVLVQEYWSGRLPLFHCDLYRLEADAVVDLGLEELWTGSGITAIEWPECLPTLPPGWLKLEFEILQDEARRITVSWQGDQHYHLWQQVMHGLAQL
jgi:tRNA threonylcarbamoyladenosine biosynthesis protein TsaE